MVKDTNQVEVNVPTAETDINAAYEDAIHVLSTKPPKEESKPDAATQQEDYYRSFRTKCVLVFCCFRGVLMSLFQRADGMGVVECELFRRHAICVPVLIVLAFIQALLVAVIL